MPRVIKPTELLPRNVAVLGELGSMVLHDPKSEEFFGLRPRDGTVLCASPDGRQMFGLRPQRDAGPPKASRQALHAMHLHERFVHKRGDAFFNCIVPTPRAPVYAGELVIIRYDVEKRIGGERGLTTWEHYFEQPFSRPAYAQLFSLGHGQYWIAPGEWRVTERGIEFFAARSLVTALGGP